MKSRLVITGNLAGSNPRLWSDYGQTGSNQLAGRISTDKRASVYGFLQMGSGAI